MADIQTIVDQTIKRADEFGLSTEVITTALKSLNKGKEVCIEKALADALSEWDIPSIEDHDEFLDGLDTEESV